MGSTGGGQFGQNDQKLLENYNISIFGSKQWLGTWGDKPIFPVVGGGVPPVPPTRGDSVTYMYVVYVVYVYVSYSSGKTAMPLPYVILN